MAKKKEVVKVVKPEVKVKTIPEIRLEASVRRIQEQFDRLANAADDLKKVLAETLAREAIFIKQVGGLKESEMMLKMMGEELVELRATAAKQERRIIELEDMVESRECKENRDAFEAWKATNPPELIEA